MYGQGAQKSLGQQAGIYLPILAPGAQSCQMGCAILAAGTIIPPNGFSIYRINNQRLAYIISCLLYFIEQLLAYLITYYIFMI